MSSSKYKVVHLPWGKFVSKAANNAFTLPIEKGPSVVLEACFTWFSIHPVMVPWSRWIPWTVQASALSFYQVKRPQVSIQNIIRKCLSKRMAAEPGMVAHTFNPRTREAKSSGSLWVEVSLVYTARFRPAKSTYWDPVSKKFHKNAFFSQINLFFL